MVPALASTAHTAPDVVVVQQLPVSLTGILTSGGKTAVDLLFCCVRHAVQSAMCVPGEVLRRSSRATDWFAVTEVNLRSVVINHDVRLAAALQPSALLPELSGRHPGAAAVKRRASCRCIFHALSQRATVLNVANSISRAIHAGSVINVTPPAIECAAPPKVPPRGYRPLMAHPTDGAFNIKASCFCYTDCMIACVDTYYFDGGSRTGVVLFEDWSDRDASKERVYERPQESADYIPGEFFRRELPCILAATKPFSSVLETLVIDGYVWLNEDGRKGLGALLYEAMGESIRVIGVAKNRFADSSAVEILRGASRKPLFITAAGTDPTEASEIIHGMHGEHRIPTLIKRADQISRHGINDSA